jgi:hypothetical protein
VVCGDRVRRANEITDLSLWGCKIEMSASLETRR